MVMRAFRRGMRVRGGGVLIHFSLKQNGNDLDSLHRGQQQARQYASQQGRRRNPFEGQFRLFSFNLRFKCPACLSIKLPSARISNHKPALPNNLPKIDEQCPKAN